MFSNKALEQHSQFWFLCHKDPINQTTSNKALVLSKIRDCMLTNEPFMNVPDAWLLCWLAVAAFKTYSNNSRFIGRSLPKYFVLPVFWGLTILHFYFIASCGIAATITALYLLMLTFLYYVRQDASVLTTVLVICGNIVNPLKFIWDVYFVFSVVKEFYEQISRIRDIRERFRTFIIIVLIPMFLACFFYGEPSAGFTHNLIPIYVAAFILGIMVIMTLALSNPTRTKVGYLLFILCVPWSRMMYTAPPPEDKLALYIENF